MSTPLIADDWLTVTPNSSFIDVDTDISITLEVRVKNNEAQQVQKATSLSCILVIRLDGGRDYFLVVSATYVPPKVSGEPIAQSADMNNADWLIRFVRRPICESSEYALHVAG